MSRMLRYLAFAAVCLPALAQTPCDRLRSMTLADTRITAAAVVADAPVPHCRVDAVLTPSSDSHIEIEVLLPLAGWNGNFQAAGNGGWAGSINTAEMTAALREGYATASTDTGHKSPATPGGSFALGHPEKLIDYGHRAVHEMTVKAKAIIAAFYGEPARLSYWNSCSNGGREGLMEAQRYPADYDGIVAGAPAANWSGRALQSIWVAQALHRDPASYIPPAKYPAIHAAVLAACDALDGVKDGVLQDPTRCKFDPAVLRCSGVDGPGCLTGPQVEAARKIYENHGAYPGLEPGSELGWATYGGAQPFAIGESYFRHVIYGDPQWDYRTLDFSDIARYRNAVTDALDPDLKPFFAHGGKLIQYHGWSDPQIPPRHSVDYYRSVVAEMGNVDSSYRLFMVPGMQHCGGGNGPNQFHALAALERWRESGIAPDQIPAAHVTNNRVDITRPLCPYPRVAHYKGAGSTNDAANFTCELPR
jgi:feruloyl esterase